MRKLFKRYAQSNAALAATTLLGLFLLLGSMVVSQAQWTGVFNPLLGSAGTPCTLISNNSGIATEFDNDAWATVTVGGATGAFNSGTGSNTTEATSGACNGHGACSSNPTGVGIDWGAGNTNIITKLDLWGPTNNSMGFGGGTAGTLTFEGSNTSSSTGFVTITTVAGTGLNNQHETCTGTTKTSNCNAFLNVTTAYRWHRMSSAAAGSSVGAAYSFFGMYRGSC